VKIIYGAINCLFLSYWYGALKRIFGMTRDEITGVLRKIHSEELHILHSSFNIIRMMNKRRVKMSEHIAQMGRNGVVAQPEGRRPLGRAGIRWEDNIQRDTV
jgi:hypothetical protein